MYPGVVLKEAHRHSSFNRTELQASEMCGCFYCCKTYAPAKIACWVHEGAGTALCPFCGIDSVIAQNAGSPIDDPAFLAAMHELWFERTYVVSEAGEATLVSGVREQAEFFQSDADDDFRRHFTPDQIASIERGLADSHAGRTVSNEEMFAEIRAKYGW